MDKKKCSNKKKRISRIDGYLHPFWIWSTTISTRSVCWLVQKMI